MDVTRYVRKLEDENRKLRLETEAAIQEKAMLNAALKKTLHLAANQSSVLYEDAEEWGKTAHATVLCRLYEFAETALLPFIDQDYEMWNLSQRVKSSWRDTYSFIAQNQTLVIEKTAVLRDSSTNTEILSYDDVGINTDRVYVTTQFPGPKYDIGVWTDPLPTQKEIETQTDDVNIVTTKSPQRREYFAPIANNGTDIVIDPTKLGLGRNPKQLWRKLREAVWSLKLLPPVLPIVKNRLQQLLVDKTSVHVAMMFSKFDTGNKGGLNLIDLRKLCGAMGVLLSQTKVKKLRQEMALETGRGASYGGLITWAEFHKILQTVSKARKSIHYANAAAMQASRISTLPNTIRASQAKKLPDESAVVGGGLNSDGGAGSDGAAWHEAARVSMKAPSTIIMSRKSIMVRPEGRKSMSPKKAQFAGAAAAAAAGGQDGSQRSMPDWVGGDAGAHLVANTDPYGRQGFL